MKAKDIFGIIVRALGLLTLLYSVWNLAFGLIPLFYAMTSANMVTGGLTAYFTSGVPGLFVGILLIRFARQVVKFCYPDGKDDSED